MERDMNAVARSLDRNPTFGLRKKAGVSKANKTIREYESLDGSTERIKFILLEFATKTFLGKVDLHKESPLHLAAKYGHTKLVALLIDAAKYLHNDDPVNPNSCFEAFIRQGNDRMNTALHLAVSNNNVDIAKLLVEADPSDRHIQNTDGETPIYLAARLGYNDIVKVICRACAAPTLDGPGVATALHAAITMLPEANKENSDVVEVIINAARRSFSPEEFVTFVRQKDNNMDSALHLAVRGNNLNVVKLISQAADADERNSRSKTPIYIAAEQGYKNIVEQLCQTCTFENAHGPGGQTALHAAIIGGNKDCVLSVLTKAENLVMRGDDEGLTPLHYAAKHKFDSVLEDLIVEKEANFENQSVYEVGEKVPTPLWLATQEGHTSTVEKLMKLLPEKSCAAVNLDGRNILHLAAFQSDREMIKCILISCPAEYTKKILNKKDVNGDTPLHLLVREGCFAQELITHAEVDKMAKNNQHYTAIDMLYLEDQIIMDQLQIKIAFDDTANHHSNYWSRSSNWKSNLPNSLVPPTKRSRKDKEFKKAEEQLMKKGLELYRERTSTQIVVTALITTVTFTVGFTLPGGYHQSGEHDEGMALLSKKTAFKVFMVADALALVLSTTSLFLYFISSMYQDPRKVSILNAVSTGLNIFSVVAMMLTFIAGTYVVLSHSLALAITVCVICCIFFLIVVFLSIQMIYDRHRSKVKNIHEV